MLFLKLVIIGIFISGFISMVSAVPKLSLDDYLRHIRSTHPQFDKTALDVNRAKHAVNAEAYREQWSSVTDSSWTEIQPNPISPVFESADPIIQFSGTTQLSRPIWETGGSLDISQTITRRSQNSPTFAPSPGTAPIQIQPNTIHTQSLNIAYTQPLFRNNSGIQSQLAVNIAQYNADYTEVMAEESNENFLLTCVLNYLDWVRLRHYYEIASKRLALATQTYDDMQDRYDAALVEKVDLLQSKQYKNRLAVLANQAETRLNNQMRYMAKTLYFDDLLNSHPDFDIYKIPTLEPDKNLPGSRLMKALSIQESSLAHQKKALEDQQLPELDLTVGVNWHESDNTEFNATDYGLVDKYVMLQFSKPLGPNPMVAQTAVLADQLAFIETDRQDNMNNLIAEKTRLEHEFLATKNQIEQYTALLALHQDTVAAERDLYEAGRRDLPTLLQAQDDEEDARLNRLDLAYYAHVIHANYRAITDQIIGQKNEQY